jgi:hypothetical protein
MSSFVVFRSAKGDKNAPQGALSAELGLGIPACGGVNSGRLFVDDKFKPRASGCRVALRRFRNRSRLRRGASGEVKER